MKEFNNARVQFDAVDEDTEERYKFTIGDLEPDADVEEIMNIGQSLNPLLDVSIEQAFVTESHVVIL